MRTAINRVTFGGISDTTVGVKVLSVDSFKKGDVRGKSYEVIGRDGDLFISAGTVGDGELKITLAVPESKIGDVSKWLKGSGKLVVNKLSPTGKYFKARFVKALDVSPLVMTGSTAIWKVVATAVIEPFVYLTSGETTQTINTSGSSIVNLGTAASLPVVKVYGSGDTNLIIGSQIFNLSGLSGGIVLDSTIYDAYSLDGLTSMNNNVTLDDETEFPVLQVGTTVVSWDGAGITKVEIIPNWRDD